MKSSLEKLPLISVLMSVYNESEKDVIEAINSILSQTYTNIELIIIIDNVKKWSKDQIEKITDDNRVRVYVNDCNIGLARSMNKAANYARGKYLARMDADDISFPERLEKEYQYMLANDFDLVCCWFKFIDENGVVMNRNIINYTSSNVQKLLPYMNTIHHPTILMKKQVFDAVDGYRNFPCAQDYDLWLRLYSNHCKIGVVEEVLFYYRVRGDSVTSQKKVSAGIHMRVCQEITTTKKSLW